LTRAADFDRVRRVTFRSDGAQRSDAAASPDARPRGLRAVLRAALVLALPGLVFTALTARTLDYAFVWSDATEIEHGTLIRPSGTLSQAFTQPMHSNLGARLSRARQPYYRPLQVVLVSSIHNRFGKEPRAFRSAALAIGAATFALFTGFAWLLFHNPWPALAAGLLAAVHPAGLEVYVWIAGISEALADGLLLASLLAALVCARARSRGASASAGVTAVLLLLLALFAKEKPVVAPALLAVLLVSEAVRVRSALPVAPRSAFRSTALLALFVAGVGIYTLWWRPAILGGALTGAAPIGGSAKTHVLSALSIWPGALAWLVFPLHSSTSDAVRIVSSALDPRPWLGLCLAIGSALAWVQLLRRGRGVAALALAWIWIAYLPTSSLIPLLHAKGERHLFLSVFGVALLLAAGTFALARCSRLAPRRRRALALLLTALPLAFLAQRSFARQPAWASTRTLFERDVARDPAHREGRLHLSKSLSEAGLLDESERHVRVLIYEPPELASRSSFLREIEAYAHYCALLGRRGRHVAVIDFVTDTSARRPDLSRAPELRFCLADAQAALGEREAALAIYLSLAREVAAAPEPALALRVARLQVEAGRTGEANAWLGKLPPQTQLDEGELAEYFRIRRLIGRAQRARSATP
jgi:hypothetical protein